METRLERNIGFDFFEFLVKARNPKTNEVKMVSWLPTVIIEKSKCGTWWKVRTYSQRIMDFWIEKFGSDSFIFIFEDNYRLSKLLKETVKFVEPPFIPGCALTKEWIRYEIFI